MNSADADGVTAPGTVGCYSVTVQHCSCWPADSNNPSLVRVILECGADVNPVPVGKKSPSTIYQAAAARLGFDSIVRLLLEHKADVNAVTESGGTPTMTAAGSGHLSTVQLLIESKADVHSSSTKGIVGATALMIAARCDKGTAFILPFACLSITKPM
jgi:ankyrin repeat protein